MSTDALSNEHFVVFISIVQKKASWKQFTEVLYKPEDSKYWVLLSQRYTVYNSIWQETVNVSCWDWNSSFLWSLSQNSGLGVGQRLKLAPELRQAGLSPKELINAPLKEDL